MFGDTRKSLSWSIIVHSAFAFGLSAYLASTPPQSRGGSGLIGAGRTKLTMIVNVTSPARVETVPKQKLEKLLTQLKADVVIPVKVQPKKIEKPKTVVTQLPTEVKNKNTKVIEEKTTDTISPTQASADRKENGNDPDAEASLLGQGGTSEAAAEKLGNGENSNEDGEQYASIVRATQRELESPGSLIQTKITILEMIILESGVVKNVKIFKSSGEKRLDLLALDAVKRAQPYQPYKKELFVQLPVKFNVENTTRRQ